MYTGERLKFFRVFYNVSQQELADMLGVSVSQRDIVLFEKNKLQIKQEKIEILANYFECAPEYLRVGKIPAFDRFGFLSLPERSLYDLPLKIMRRKFSDLKRAMYLMRDFLKENSMSNYAEAYISDNTRRTGSIYIFMSDYHKMLFFVFVSSDFLESIESDVILPLQLVKISSAEIQSIDVSMFGLPRLMFLFADPTEKIRFVKLLTEKLALPKDMLDDFVDYATNYTTRFSAKSQKIKDLILESRIKAIIDIMQKYDIKIADIEKYL